MAKQPQAAQFARARASAQHSKTVSLVVNLGVLRDALFYCRVNSTTLLEALVVVRFFLEPEVKEA